MGVLLTTSFGRISFPKLVKASKYMPDSKSKFSVALLLPKADPKLLEFLGKLKEAVNTEAQSVGGANGKAAALSNFTNLKDGDDPSRFKTYRGEYAGHYVLNMSRNEEQGKPRTVNRDRMDIDPSELYAGCNGRASISVFGYTAGPKKGVSISFDSVQKSGENTPFSSTGRPVEDAFSSLDLPAEDPGQGVKDMVPPASTTGTPPLAPTPATSAPAANKDPFAGV
jgi:hypothetical protein